MAMRPVLYAFAVLVLMSCTAQKQGLRSYHISMLQEADLLFIQEDYKGASIIYDRVLEANPSHALSNLRTGICRLNIRNEQTTALMYLERAKEQEIPEATYYIGLALHFQENFSGATNALEQYLKSGDEAIPEPEVRSKLAMVKRAERAYSAPKNYRLENLGEKVNSAFPDYVPVISADGTQLYFTSRREGGMSNEQDPNGEFFEDIYHSVQQVDGSWSRAENLGAPVNMAGHDATVALSPSGNKMLIYRTNILLDGGDIFYTNRDAATWSEPIKLSERINSRFFEPSATLAADERTIYFSSNRPGGYGGKDLYRVVELPDGSWSYPINLGPNINTPGHEDGPFISADGTELYFSSTGHNSIGGYDVYKSELNPQTNQWGEPQTLGHPVNTVFDDIYLVMEASGKVGYYSTNRKGGHGDHDIYRVEFGAQDPKIMVKGVVQNQDDEPMSANILVRQTGGETAEKYQSGAESGKFILILQPDTEYSVEFVTSDCETLTLKMQYEEELGTKYTEHTRTIKMSCQNAQTTND